MAKFEEKLNSILGNQEAMGQIMALARSLSGEGKDTAPTASPSEENSGEAEEAVTRDVSETSAQGPDLTQLLGEVDPGMLQMGMRLFREYQSTDDRNAALLQALRPFLKEERRAKLDKAVRLARMTRLIRAALGSIGEKGDGEGV